MISAREIAILLWAGRFDLTHEAQTQSTIETYLRRELGPATDIQREVRLGPGERPDFVIDGRIVIEVKVAGATGAAIVKQLGRYARHDAITDLVLATGKSVQAPKMINGKPVLTVNLGRAWL
jgi:hypothetical protein